MADDNLSSSVTIHNVVATANFDCKLDITQIAWTYHGKTPCKLTRLHGFN
jgi:TATA-box binding protein (TBP) (component of TFIID and TFIIIB)